MHLGIHCILQDVKPEYFEELASREHDSIAIVKSGSVLTQDPEKYRKALDAYHNKGTILGEMKMRGPLST